MNTYLSVLRVSALMICIVFGQLAYAVPGEIDPSFRSAVEPPAARGLRTFALQDDGRIIVAPWVSSFNRPKATNGITRLNADGSFDESFKTVVFENKFATPAGTLPTPQANTIVVLPDRKILIGGGFDTVNDIPRHAIMRLEPDGALDESFDWFVNLRFVWSIRLQADGKVLIGGAPHDFGTGVLRLNSDGSSDESFAPQTEGGVVATVVLQPDGKIIVAGSFQAINGVRRDHLARLNTDGSLDMVFNNPRVGGFFREVNSLAMQANGKIVIGGTFESVAGVSRRGIARLNPDGSLDPSFNPGTGLNFNRPGGSYDNRRVDSVTVQSDGKILISGVFERIDGISRTNVARLNPDGSVDLAFNPPSAVPSGANLALQPDGKVLVGGSNGGFANPSATNLLVRLYGGDALPALTLTRTGGTALTWTVSEGAGYGLEFTDALGSAGDWRPEPSETIVVGEHYLVPIDTSLGSRFFRLRRE